MVVLDTSALIAAIDLDERDHHRVSAFFQTDPGPFIIPAGILSEVTFVLDKRFGAATTNRFLANLETGAFVLDCGDGDLSRIRELIRRYRDLPLGYADAAVIACAERNGRQVATLDLRHFGVVAREGTIQIVP
ncbi:MAG: PIN domain-containing protein [Thermomicrobiales bacterium]|nr:PIN domain-containing protein [Thermomicrobiales bacterium]